MSGKLLADASMDELLQAMRRLDWLTEMRGMTRTQWAEARHVIRYVYQDLHGVHTGLEAARDGWAAGTVLELESAIGRLTALRDYLVKPEGKARD